MLLTRCRHLEKCPCQCSVILCCIYSPSERSTLSLHVKKKAKNILFICWFHLAIHDNYYYRVTIITSTTWMYIIVPHPPLECTSLCHIHHLNVHHCATSTTWTYIIVPHPPLECTSLCHIHHLNVHHCATSTTWMYIIVPKEEQTFSWLQFKMEEKISLQWATLLAWALHCPNRPSTTWLCRGDHLQLTWALSKPQICPAPPSGAIHS